MSRLVLRWKSLAEMGCKNWLYLQMLSSTPKVGPRYTDFRLPAFKDANRIKASGYKSGEDCLRAQAILTSNA